MRDTARGIRFVVARTWRASPPRVMVSAVVTLLLAFVPALQVLALATLVERLDGEHTLRDVLAPLLVIVAIVGLANPVRAVATTLRVDADHTVIADLERELMLRAARTPPRDLARAETTARLQKQVEVAHASAQYLYGQLVGAIESVVATIAVVAALATFSRLAALLTVLALVPALIAGRLLAGVWRRYWDVVGPIFGRQRYLSNLLVRQRSAVELATLGAGDAVAARHGRLWRDLVGHRIRLSRRELASDWIVGAVSTVFVLGALVALLVGTDLSPVAVAGVTGVTGAAASVGMAGVQIGRVLSAAPQVTEIADFLAGVPLTDDDGATRPSPSGIEELRVRGLTHTYPGRAAPAVADVAFEARRGEVVALVGANGAGKTTALHALLGLLTPDAGTVTLDGLGPDEVGQRPWLRRFATMVQEYERYEFTVRENLQLGRSPDDAVPDEALWRALELAGLTDLVRSLPDGLDTQLGEQWDGTTLSGGQWQRLSVARVAVRDAPVWVLDEPTSAIDAESEEAILERLVAGKEERITVLVSHRAWTLRAVDRIYVLDGGRVVEHGSYRALVAADGPFSRLFRNQLAGAADESGVTDRALP
ncbi:ABC transporter ATP-binding protein [Miniimonas sp. S16]|uniref:ATP-binding cassette domain-containing protein n=1 Tax=Miniimonas sp. S16 TaxID=2171623 RepID=UPI00131EF5E8|nr:ABC transporter ATP-binding protein [Miniimonas sp. S16]